MFTVHNALHFRQMLVHRVKQVKVKPVRSDELIQVTALARDTYDERSGQPVREPKANTVLTGMQDQRNSKLRRPAVRAKRLAGD